MQGPSVAALFRGRSIWRRPWEYEEPTLLFFFSFFLFFFFFGGYGAWGSTPLQLLLSGGMACVVATCHAKID